MEVIATTQSFVARRRRLLLTLLIAVSGLAIGIFWFARNLTLPPHSAGLQCCDAARFLWLSTHDLKSAFFQVSDRSFAYPFYLAIFRWLCSDYKQEVFFVAAFTAQFAISILSLSALFFSLRHAGLRLPVISWGLLLAHPALAGIAAVPLTDSLGTSLTAVLIGLLALLYRSQSKLWIKTLALGFIASVLLAVRPPSAGLVAIASLITIITIPVIAWMNSRRVWFALRATCIGMLCYVIGFLPVGGHLFNNCYTSFKQICIIDPSAGIGAMASSLKLSSQYARAWGTVDPTKLWEWRFTDDPILEGCEFLSQDVVGSTKRCYLKNIWRLPHHFLNRTFGLFDYRHLNPYGALETSFWEVWLLRGAAIISLIGLVGCVGSLIFNRSIYLLVPLLFFSYQVNLHTENRYLLPAIPTFFLVGVGVLNGAMFQRRWIQRVCLVISTTLVALYIRQVLIWDEESLRAFGSL